MCSYLLAADADHHYFLCVFRFIPSLCLVTYVLPAEWKTAYPEAKMIGVEGLAEKKAAESWKFDEGNIVSQLSFHVLIQCLAAVYAPGAENEFGFESDVSFCVAQVVYFAD